MWKLFLKIFLTILILDEWVEGREPIVNIEQGTVRGKVFESRTGRQYLGFLGIPYAKAERFQLPGQPPKWEGQRDCSRFRNKCLQYDRNLRGVVGSEDCLYLNVYTPVYSNPKHTRPPVIIFIHGGSFMYNSGMDYSPKYLMDDDVIIVTFNFRMGALGFLTTLDRLLPANLGMRDQVAALQWVKKNIKSFGGDDNRITLMGSSSGAASVSYHLISPLSKGLFHRAISLSGTALCPWSMSRSPVDVAMRFTKTLSINCSLANSYTMAACLKKADARELIEKQQYLTGWKTDGHPILQFAPDNSSVSYNCPICPSYTTMKSSTMKAHLISKHKGERIIWNKLTPVSCRVTQNRIKKEYKYPCSSCDCSYKYERSLTPHMKIHDEHFNFCCTVCGRLEKINGMMRSHYKNQHHNNVSRLLQRHLDSHKNSEASRTCTTCGKIFSRAGNCKIHMQMHDPNFLDFQRNKDGCVKRFSGSGNLKRHQEFDLVHNPVPKFSCSNCHRKFTHPNGLKMYLMRGCSTIPEPQYRCGTCQKGYHRLKSLQTHEHRCEQGILNLQVPQDDVIKMYRRMINVCKQHIHIDSCNRNKVQGKEKCQLVIVPCNHELDDGTQCQQKAVMFTPAPTPWHHVRMLLYEIIRGRACTSLHAHCDGHGHEMDVGSARFVAARTGSYEMHVVKKLVVKVAKNETPVFVTNHTEYEPYHIYDESAENEIIKILRDEGPSSKSAQQLAAGINEHLNGILDPDEDGEPTETVRKHPPLLFEEDLVVESSHSIADGIPIFLPDSPTKLFREGKFQKIPWITGVNSADGVTYGAATILNSTQMLKYVDSHWSEFAPLTFMYETAPNPRVVSQKIRDYYFGTTGRANSDKGKVILSNALSDRHFFRCTKHSALLYAKHSQVWIYYFTMASNSSILENYGIRDNLGLKGVVHSDEIQYIFLTNLFPEIRVNTQYFYFSQDLVRLFVSFATDGKPTKLWGNARKWDPLPPTQIKPESFIKMYNIDSQTSVIDSQTSVIDKPFHRLAFWDTLRLHPAQTNTPSSSSSDSNQAEVAADSGVSRIGLFCTVKFLIIFPLFFV